jgi:Protein tyrosine and serine/threonine kinase
MAPEVAALQEYGFGCDVYSFSIMLWEICTLKRAFDDLSSSSAFNEEVVRGNKRPSLSIISSPALRDLLSQGWDKNACARPPFLMIVETLEEEIKVVSKKLGARTRPSFSRSQSLQMPISAPPGNLRMLLNRARSAIELQSGEESRGSSSRERAGFYLGLDLTKRSRRFRLSIDPPPPVLDRSMGSTA